MPERIHFEDLLGGLVHDAITHGLRKREFQQSITLPEHVTWQSFWEELKRLQQKYEDYSALRASGRITQDLLNKFWNEPVSHEEEIDDQERAHRALLV